MARPELLSVKEVFSKEEHYTIPPFISEIMPGGRVRLYS